MATYFFVLGRSLALCRAEFEALLPYSGLIVQKFVGNLVIAEGPDGSKIPALMQTSGGIVKGGVVLQQLESVSADPLLASLLAQLSKSFTHTHKVSVGISAYGNVGIDTRQTVRQLKDRAKEQGITVRYIQGEYNDLSSVQVEKQGLLESDGIEFVLLRMDSEMYLCKTLAVQPFEEWSHADYGRPQRDAHSGMLPPKVARMMLNLGLAHISESSTTTPYVFDPFCGSGTILTEGLRLGVKVGGSDLSEKAVADTRANIDWISTRTKGYLLQTVYPFTQLPPEAALGEVFVSEAAHIGQKLGKNMVDLIVTETYLGPAFEKEPTPGKFERIVKGLEKLYIGAFKSIYDVLKPGGILVFAEPEYYMYGKSFSVGIVDNGAKFGYTLMSKPIVYKREKAFVGRRIGILQKKFT
jgi:tRNA G10  N-methylase Trm11